MVKGSSKRDVRQQRFDAPSVVRVLVENGRAAGLCPRPPRPLTPPWAPPASLQLERPAELRTPTSRSYAPSLFPESLETDFISGARAGNSSQTPAAPRRTTDSDLPTPDPASLLPLLLMAQSRARPRAPPT